MNKKSARFRVPTLVEWRAQHRSHGEEQIQDHDTPRWCWHACPCGAVLVTLTQAALSAETAASLQARG